MSLLSDCDGYWIVEHSDAVANYCAAWLSGRTSITSVRISIDPSSGGHPVQAKMNMVARYMRWTIIDV